MFPTPPGVPPELAVPPQVPRPAPPERLPADRCPAVARLLRDGDRDAFLAHVRRAGTPLVDDLGDGTCAVTFVVPDRAGTAEVHVLPNKLADAAHPAATAAERLPGAWVLTLRMPRDWRAGYGVAELPERPAGTGPAPDGGRRARALAAVPGHRRPAVAQFLDVQAAARPDPLAREHLVDGTSVASLPGAPAPPRPGGPRGTVLHGDLGGRPVWLHDPAGTDPGEPLPVVVLTDGHHRLADGLPAVLDGAVAAAALPPVRTVGVAARPGDGRTRELGCDPGFTAFLAEDVLGWAAGHRALTVDPARTVVAGQSLGGLTAVYATQAAPDRFGLALSQSGSFWWPNTHDDREWLTSVLPSGPRTHGVLLEVGSEEWVLRDATRRVADVLAARGDLAGLHEFRGGHDPACWRAGLVPALGTLLHGRDDR
ncbi:MULTISPECIES: alpha/beta hydrolase-fold protein [unclassified Pseudonocardia]|uniref:alpha/beta hydrolase-fold protein n=1 Tax=unclassified Pseudonocardia TaxID=2619320 RepID=UPI00094B71C7|nr:alpha/beta hydrolase-fold protein [Pseudonocardia sp. Ae707_Ps1]OLM20358.1 enterochelin esterase [Pseudonocardia sp. Ae707_Ps1]